MKKTYEKPRAMMEYFTLSQSIANGCGWNSDDSYSDRPTHGTPQTCAWVGADGTRYWTSTAVCEDSYSEDIIIEEGCYNAPSGSNQIFAS